MRHRADPFAIGFHTEAMGRGSCRQHQAPHTNTKSCMFFQKRAIELQAAGMMERTGDVTSHGVVEDVKEEIDVAGRFSGTMTPSLPGNSRAPINHSNK